MYDRGRVVIDLNANGYPKGSTQIHESFQFCFLEDKNFFFLSGRLDKIKNGNYFTIQFIFTVVYELYYIF